MMGKPRTKPYHLLCYEALFRNLKPQYRDNSTIYKDYMNRVAGYQGEKGVDYFLSVASLKNASVYKDVRLHNGNHAFQMDSLLVTPNFILIVEAKNLTGELTYDKRYEQLIQTTDNQRKRVRNPMLQSATQKMHLQAWLQTFHFPPLPIETLSVISNPNAIITSTDDSPLAEERLLHAESLPEKLKAIAHAYQNVYYDSMTHKRLRQTIRENNRPSHPDLIAQYSLSSHHFVRGIVCPMCHYYPLKRLQKKWTCTKCGVTDKHAHEQKIYDHFLLAGQTITNKTCRRILHIDNSTTARSLLQSMKNLRQTGQRKSTTYQAPNLKDYPQQTSIPSESERKYS